MSAPRRQALNDAQIPLPAEVIDIVLSDLQARGLADTGMLGGMVSENSVYSELATARGRELMAFVQIMATPEE